MQRFVRRIGGTAAVVLALYSLLTIAQMVLLGGAPRAADEMFHLLNTDRWIGLLRLDLPSLTVMPLYGLLFLGIHAVVNNRLSFFALVLVVTGVVLMFSVPTPFAALSLADHYAAATDDRARAELLQAGQSYLASDLWHGPRAMAGGFLIELGAFLTCIAMLPASAFSRLVAWSGIAIHGLDALHVVAMPFAPGLAATLLMIAGPFYPIWLALTGRALFRTATKATAV